MHEEIIYDKGARKLYSTLTTVDDIDYIIIKTRTYVPPKKVNDKDISGYWNEESMAISREEFAVLIDYVKNKEFKDIRKSLEIMKTTISDMEDKLYLHKW